MLEHSDSMIDLYERTGKIQNDNGKLLIEKIFNRINAANNYLYLLTKLAQSLKYRIDEIRSFNSDCQTIRDLSNEIYMEIHKMAREYEMDFFKDNSYPDNKKTYIDCNEGMGGGTD